MSVTSFARLKTRFRKRELHPLSSRRRQGRGSTLRYGNVPPLTPGSSPQNIVPHSPDGERSALPASEAWAHGCGGRWRRYAVWAGGFPTGLRWECPAAHRRLARDTALHIPITLWVEAANATAD